jgi:hypothetical protein
MRAVSPSLVRTVVAVSTGWSCSAPRSTPDSASVTVNDTNRFISASRASGDNAPTSLPSMLDMSR